MWKKGWSRKLEPREKNINNSKYNNHLIFTLAECKEVGSVT